MRLPVRLSGGNAMSPCFRIFLSVLLPLACFTAGSAVHAASAGFERLTGNGGEAVSHVVSGSAVLVPSHGKEGIRPGSSLPGSRSPRPRRRKLRDDDTGDGEQCLVLHYDNEKRKIGAEPGFGVLSDCAANREVGRVVRELFPERGSGLTLLALSGSLLLSRPPPAGHGSKRANRDKGFQREITENSY